MTILSALYTLIISPLELLFEVIFTIANKVIGNEGISIIFLSLAVNFLVLPLYKRADELQAEERDIQAIMAPHVKHIKKKFKGDERFFMLQEYYRINHYKPIYALKSSVSLLLQIPFFMAAYNLLSGMQNLQGMKFGFIADLGKEDALFMIGNFPVNVLPILMTLINIISGIIYTKGHPLKAKIQVYGLAAVFLVLLYHSPAGLVFYWLLNNVFSLVKNIFYKLKDPRRALYILLAVSGVGVFVSVFFKSDFELRQKALLAFAGFLLTLPLIVRILSRKIKFDKFIKPAKKDASAYFFGTVFMALITGFLIPASVISSSPEEFVDMLNPSNPFLYVVNSMLLSFGSWVLWGGVFYFFMSDKIKAVFSSAVWIICGVSVFNYMLFGTDLGMISTTLQYESIPSFRIREYCYNILAIMAITVVLYLLYAKLQKITKLLLVIGTLSIVVISAKYALNISKVYKENVLSRVDYINSSADETPTIELSTEGNNVIVLMIDRAIGPLVPYIFNEKPELYDQFDGFTYYPNTISYGVFTNVGTPALYGGYEYTPEKMNERNTENNSTKQNEALKVMPAIFSKNGFNVTVCDPSYAGYKWTPDLSIYDDYPDFRCFNTMGAFSYYDDDSIGANSDFISSSLTAVRNRNFFCFAMMKVSPLVIQETLYDGGMYNDSSTVSAVSQRMFGTSKSSGYSMSFLESYCVLKNLPDMTVINDSSDNTFLMLANNTAHSQCILQEPDYVPSLTVDNTAYDVNMEERYTIDGVTMEMSTEKQVSHYHVNMAAYLKLGEWFDYLREQGVWDNTRIIIVADHGRALYQFGVTCNGYDMQDYMPTLMVKDFNATGFTVCEDFMTNADTPVLATEGLIDNPVNPFTGNPINSDAKNGPQPVFYSEIWNPGDNNGTTFLPGSWFCLTGGNPHDPENWSYLGDY